MEIKKEQDEELMKARHSLAHVLAKALMQIYPDTKLTIGPAIENGFYYDIDLNHSITPEEYGNIEKKMKEIINKGEEFTRKVVSKADALKLFAGNEYKTEIINELPDGEEISLYYTGDDFFDLCRGPHVDSTRRLQNYAFKIHAVNGAYWRGSEKNKMLQRVYAYAFKTKKDLADYLNMIEEAKQREHRKLGKELNIFMFDELIGKGLPMYLPNGFILRKILSDYIINKELEKGYKHVMTPSLGNVDLYKTSGHWDHYKEDMFPAMELDNEAYVLRPMNCPHHMVMFKRDMHSYRDLPIRIAEIANDFRFEDSGNLCGLERARAFTQNDSHIFCTSAQIADEIEGVISLILEVYKDFGFKNYTLRLSLRDKNDAEKYFGNDELWEKSENALREIIKASGANYYEAIGEAAFYGPKIDVQVNSALGHEVTLSTVQLDYQLPEKFDLEYIDENNQKQRPVVIHRAILGSLDRFIAFLLEESKGLLPLWLAPEQVRVLSLTDRNNDYAEKIKNELRENGIRAESDLRNEKIGYKIREALSMKLPYLIIVGDEEESNNAISIRGRGFENKSGLKLSDFIDRLKNEIKSKKI